ncbi:MAG: hypothetical protein ACYDCK_14675 [Thermoplasmatota archaeon]
MMDSVERSTAMKRQLQRGVEKGLIGAEQASAVWEDYKASLDVPARLPLVFYLHTALAFSLFIASFGLLASQLPITTLSGPAGIGLLLLFGSGFQVRVAGQILHRNWAAWRLRSNPF